MATKAENLSAVAELIADFRKGEIPKPTAAHVERWLNQFDPGEQSVVLSGTKRFLEKTYVPHKEAKRWLGMLLKTEKLTGPDPKAWMKKATFLRLQKFGTSQEHFLELADEVLQENGLKLKDCGKVPDSTYVYLDDCLFSGRTVIKDLKPWLENYGGGEGSLYVITAGTYTGGRHYASKTLLPLAKEKKLKLSFWHLYEMGDYLNLEAEAAVLRPAVLPPDPDVKAYFASLDKRGQVLRKPATSSYDKDDLFDSEADRQALEGAFLKAGVKIFKAAKNPNPLMRPLGYFNLQTLGFGATFFTYRNSANNLPLALWYGDPDNYPKNSALGMWYPLVPRRPK